MTFESEGSLVVAIYIWLLPASYVVFLTTLVLILYQYYILYILYWWHYINIIFFRGWQIVTPRKYCTLRRSQGRQCFPSGDSLPCNLLKNVIFIIPTQRRCSNPAVVPGASVHGPCEHDRDYTIVCFFVKLARHVNHDERMNPIDFGGRRSKVKVTIDIYGNKLVNMIKTLCASSSYFAGMLSIMRGWTLSIWEARGQRSRSQLTFIEISLWTRYRLNCCVLLHKTWQTY